VILLSLGLLGFALVDLVRWSPDRVGGHRAALGICVGAVGTGVIAALAGAAFAQTVAVLMISAAALTVWVAFDYPPLKKGPSAPLVWLGAVLAALSAWSGSVGPISGLFQDWYKNLGFGFVESVPVDQFVLGLSAMLFMAASVNRIVRLVLDATGVSWKRSESALPGGRILGPLERFIVFAIVLAGDPAAAAIVVTGKGLLRFPEIRSKASKPGPDAVTEYFLIGTFTSLAAASLLAIVVLAAS
jgi:hypothetical protein